MADDEKRENQRNGKEAGSAKDAPEAERAEPEDEFEGFTGSHRHSIDAKGRMIIPAEYREHLGKRFAVAPSPDLKRVALYPMTSWKAEKRKYEELYDQAPMALPLLRRFTKYSFTACEADGQGRLLLPYEIREWRLGDARDVMVIGVDTYVEIVPFEMAQKEDRMFDEQYPDPLMAKSDLLLQIKEKKKEEQN